jgi:hypothetical protein
MTEWESHVLNEDQKDIATGDYAHVRFARELTPDLREIIAKAIHDAYRHAQWSKTHSRDLSMSPWGKLPGYLKDSNRQQADHIFDKLHRIGCTVHKVVDHDIMPIMFTKDEIEVMAEMEHDRWKVERFLGGWKWSKKRDLRKKTSPYLVNWTELPEDIKEWDRDTVRKIPEFLAEVGLEIRRV